MQNASKMEQMQDLLLSMMADLSDPKTEKQEEIDGMVKRARAMKEIGDTMVKSAFAEISYLNKVGKTKSTAFGNIEAPNHRALEAKEPIGYKKYPCQKANPSTQCVDSNHQCGLCVFFDKEENGKPIYE
jgi:hypothetical protein